MILAVLLACGPDEPAPVAAGGDTGVADDATTGGTTAGDDTTTGDTEAARVLDPEQPVPNDVAFRTDVIVVGAGASGLAAASDALAAGADVVVLEREATWGGAAMWSGGSMIFSGTPEQAAIGVEDSPATLLAEWPAITGGDAADPWTVFLAENNVAMVHDWLAERGVIFDDPHVDPAAGSLARIHTVRGWGEGLVDAIGGDVPASAIRYETEVTDLVRARDGRVIGVVYTSLASGRSRVAYADAVVVATGGFLHDLDRVREVRTELADIDLTYGSWSGDDGNGLTLLESAGAATQNLGAIGLYAHATPAPGDDLDEMLVPFLQAVPWVNANGARFADESETNSFRVGWAKALQPDGLAWAIVDDAYGNGATFTTQGGDGTVYSLAELEQMGMAMQADDFPTLAASIGVDADTFGDEIAAYNAYARGEADDAFRGDDGMARPVELPPFHALPIATTVAKGFGGVDVDLSGRVLDTSGAPIPGLYAAGELTGMIGGSIVGDSGFTGSLTAVVLGGRVAGASAAAEALAE